MDFAAVVGVIKDLLTLLAVLIGVILAVFVYYQFVPVLVLRILPRWVNAQHTLLCVRVEIENKSRVRVSSPQGLLQVLEHPLDPEAPLGHWVAFNEKGLQFDDPVVEWKKPVSLFGTTRSIYPGETYAVERIYHCPHEKTAIHIGLQVFRKKRMIDRLLSGAKEDWRQTTTGYVFKE